jgi:hypothetical protein
MSPRCTKKFRPNALSAGLLALALASVPLSAGEKMIEVAPSKPGTRIAPTVKPMDPVLDRVLNSGKIDSGFNPGNSTAVPTAPNPSAGLDPLLQKRWGAALDKRRNWLLENAATVGGNESTGLKASEDYPRFTQPAGDAQKPGFGDRYLRATESANSQHRRSSGNGGDPNAGQLGGEIDPTTGQPRNILDGIGGISSGSVVAGANGTFQGANPGNRIGASAFAEQGRFSAPGQTQLDLNRQAAASDRAAMFDRLLSGSAPATATTPAAAPDPAGIFSLTRTPGSRAQQFQNLLAGPEPQKTPSATAFGSSAFGTSAGLAATPGVSPSRSALPGITGLGDRTLSPSAIPGSAPAIVRPPAPKFEPRPALLPIPTRGL